jgi:hypothetical protein
LEPSEADSTKAAPITKIPILRAIVPVLTGG